MTKNNFDDLATIMAKISHTYADLAKSYNLTLNELHVLYHIDTIGACSPSVISKRWSFPKQTMNSTCSKLIKKDFIVYSQSDTDKRKRVIHLTPAGQDFTQPIVQKINQAERNASKEFGIKNFTNLISNLQKIEQLLDQNINK